MAEGNGKPQEEIIADLKARNTVLLDQLLGRTEQAEYYYNKCESLKRQNTELRDVILATQFLLQQAKTKRACAEAKVPPELLQ